MRSNMQVAVKIFFFVFWVSPFTVAEDQECSKKDINFENYQKSGLEQKYNPLAVVKLTCVTGYVGYLKIQCQDGKWNKISERECKKKPCGHPGDTPNGNFQLLRETEFVFGATVEYTCRPGYVMASRINYRNCRSQGWDNAVPICEVVKCPTIGNIDYLIVSGNTEDASYGDVIHFECKSPHKMLSGKADLDCKENGRWSEKIPTCIDITCPTPIIPHGFTTPNQEYRENDILRYTCEDGYNSRPGTPKCTRYGWSIKPECEEIVCLLGARTAGIDTTNPKGKNIFKAGEYVEIICSETYWVYGTKQQSGKIECLKTTKWRSNPVCEEIKCDRPSEEHMNPVHPWWKKYPLDEEVSYSCKHGYENHARQATCTKSGWEPKPLCIEKLCIKPEISHGKVVGSSSDTYKLKTVVHIQCDDGYEPENFSIICNDNKKWDNMQSCSLKKVQITCSSPNVPNGIVQVLDQSYVYTCKSKYKAFDGKWWGVVQCTEDNKWSYEPQCISEDQCGVNVHAKPSQENKVYENEEIAEFECQSKPCCFKCVRGKWEKHACESNRCGPPPHVENAIFKITSHSPQKVEYTCQENYKIEPEKTISCKESKWEQAPSCESIVVVEKHQCRDPERSINNATLIRSNLKAYYEEGGTVSYRCEQDFNFQNGSNAICSEGQWNYPQCIKKAETKTTQLPVSNNSNTNTQT